LLQITGLDNTKQLDQSHLEEEYPGDQPIVYVVGHLSELKVYGKAGAKVHTWQLDPRSIFMQGDWERPESSPDIRGQLDISGTAVNSDVIPFDLRRTIVVQNKKRTVVTYFAMVSAMYSWRCQYLAELPHNVLEALHGLLGNYRLFSTSPPKTISAISGLQVGKPCDAVLGGESADILVSAGMGILFKAEALGVPALNQVAGVVVSTRDGIMVQVVLNVGQLPPPGNTWNRFDEPASFQTNLALKVPPEDVTAVIVCYPTVLWPYPENTTDRHIVGHIDLVWNNDGQTVSRLSTPAEVIQGAYGLGPLAGTVQVHLYRLGTLNPRVALGIAARGPPGIYGSLPLCLVPYQDFIWRRVVEFVHGKPKITNTSSADNTLHLRLSGPLFSRILYKYLQMDVCEVSVKDGVFFITAPSWEAAKMLLLRPGQADGVFDLREFGWGVVEMFAPIVFKWEIYDTTRGRDNARSPDGFVAITFSGYEERDRHDRPGGLKDTRRHSHTIGQMYKRPSACPGF